MNESTKIDAKITNSRSEKTRIEQLNRKLENLVTSSNVQTVKTGEFNEYITTFNEIVDKIKIR
jgi:hypothetical protein